MDKNLNLQRQPALFIGHGSPMLALQHDAVSQKLTSVGTRLLAMNPKALLVVSAHWFTRGTFVQSDPHPRQVNDMYGFPPELYHIHYRPNGSRELTQRVLELAPSHVSVDDSWGIDHGVWTPLVHMLPGAPLPVVELSVNGLQDATYAYELGRLLAPLRDEGFAILGSGNVVHNLRALRDTDRPDCRADAFNSAIKQAILARNDAQVLAYQTLPTANFAVPSPDHFLPLPTILGAAAGEDAEVFNDVSQMGALTMTSFAFGLSLI